MSEIFDLGYANLSEKTILDYEQSRKFVESKALSAGLEPHFLDEDDPIDWLRDVSTRFVGYLLANPETFEIGDTRQMFEQVAKRHGRTSAFEIPSDHLRSRPHVIYLPFWERAGVLKAYSEQMQSYLKVMSDSKTVVTNPEILDRVITDLLPHINGTPARKEARSVLQKIFHIYAANLNLYRMVQDEQGTVMRWGHDDDNDQIVTEEVAFSFLLNPTQRKLASEGKVTYWHRSNAGGYYSQGRKLYLATVGSLENSHYLTLDPGEENAICAIQRR